MEEKFTLYVETTIPSYLVSRPSRDLVISSNQTVTHLWWNEHWTEFDLYSSAFVIDECSAGDSMLAARRLQLIEGIPLIRESTESLLLAEELQQKLNLPDRVKADVIHISLCAFHGIKLLLTWNCKHLANARLFSKIERICSGRGLVSPTICTPLQLMEKPE